MQGETRMNTRETYKLRKKFEKLNNGLNLITTSRLALSAYDLDDVIGRRIYDTLYRGEIQIEDELEKLEKLISKLIIEDGNAK